MGSPKYFFVLVVTFVLFVVGGSGRAAAQQPDPVTDGSAVQALLDQLAASPDPVAGFAKLSPEQQALVTKSLQVAEVEVIATDADITVGEGAMVESYGDDTTNRSSCRSHTAGRQYKSAVGVRLFTYYQKLRWCYDGTKITSVSRTRWAEVHAPFWDFKGHQGNSTSWGQNRRSYRAWTQGKFALCFIHCGQYKYPWLEQTIYRNGHVSQGQGG